MTLAPGQRFGPYEVVSALGAGGMGEVYRAKDLRLKRDVALKILPAAFQSDPERLVRFEREAQALASVNHPNIAAIYGVDEAAGIRALALELVDGPTLADRLASGPLPLDETLHVARQICNALTAAHEKGFVHRDLKPANIKLRPDGTVKVLDFGLAKALDETVVADAATSPTVTALGTRLGVIVGTAAYMSPEQARGKPVDRRADLWAFGCVLYEMLTGRPAFAGDTVTDVLSAVIGRDPDWTLLPGDVPTAIHRLVRRCLQKDTNRRLRDAADAGIEIDESHADDSAIASSRMPARPWWKSRRGLAAIAVGLTVALIVIAFVATRNIRREPQTGSRPLLRLTLPVPNSLALTDSRIALSPDGTRLAFAAVGPAGGRLYLQDLNGGEPRAITGTENAREPFFSPDGEWIAVVATGRLVRVNVKTALPQIVCLVTSRFSGGAWTPDGSHIIYASGELYRVPATGGRPERVAGADAATGKAQVRYPNVLPNGTTVLLSSWVQSKPAEIVALDLRTGRRDVIGPGEDARYIPTGHLVFAKDRAMFVVPFDPIGLKLTGPAAPLIDTVAQTAQGGAIFSHSSASQAVYVRTLRNASRTLVWVDRSGAIAPLPMPAKSYQGPRISPDGRLIVAEVLDLPHSIWVYEPARGRLTRLTTERASHNPIWSSDGNRVIYAAAGAAEGLNNLFWKLADGSGVEERLTTGEQQQNALAVTPDGKVLMWEELSIETRNIWMGPTRGDSRPRPLLKSAASETMARFSPDGRWVAYVSNVSGRDEVYVQPFPDLKGKWQVSTDGGTQPVWAASGRELFYRRGESMIAVDVTTQPIFSAGSARVLFNGRFLNRDTGTDYDVAPDGRRFLMVQSVEDAAPVQFQFVLEWFDELKRRAPPNAR